MPSPHTVSMLVTDEADPNGLVVHWLARRALLALTTLFFPKHEYDGNPYLDPVEEIEVLQVRIFFAISNQYHGYVSETLDYALAYRATAADIKIIQGYRARGLLGGHWVVPSFPQELRDICLENFQRLTLVHGPPVTPHPSDSSSIPTHSIASLAISHLLPSSLNHVLNPTSSLSSIVAFPLYFSSFNQETHVIADSSTYIALRLST
ncbi:hypothetical protein BC629DRAFT_1741854 [Irpex lacteus]|nr:hypothetical protein BC629DRAFT_1741854 [Irpex lacteus]